MVSPVQSIFIVREERSSVPHTTIGVKHFPLSRIFEVPHDESIVLTFVRPFMFSHPLSVVVLGTFWVTVRCGRDAFGRDAFGRET